MNSILSLFQGVFSFFKSVKKSMYRNCAILITGTVVVSVVSFSSTCYGGSGKNHVIVNAESSIGDEAENMDDDPEEEVVLFASAEELQIPAPLFAKYTKSLFDGKRNDVEADIEAREVMLVNADYINPIISVTDEDYNNLVRIVEAEATGLDVKAKILVANVIINRVFHGDFPNTVTEVIYQGNGEQFQPIRDGRFYSVGLTDSSYEAVDRALLGEDYSEGALFFASTASSGPNSWFATHLVRLFDYNGHVFFTYYK